MFRLINTKKRINQFLSSVRFASGFNVHWHYIAFRELASRRSGGIHSGLGRAAR